MKSSFKHHLHSFIRDSKSQMVRLDTIHRIAERHGKKQRTAERILNVGRSPEVETLYNEKVTPKQIKGYRWIKDVTVHKSGLTK